MPHNPTHSDKMYSMCTLSFYSNLQIEIRSSMKLECRCLENWPPCSDNSMDNFSIDVLQTVDSMSLVCQLVTLRLTANDIVLKWLYMDGSHRK